MAHPPLIQKAQQLLDDLPPYLADDLLVQRIVDTVSRELERIEQAAFTIRQTAFPAQTDDTYQLLSLWETLLGLPVDPPGVSEETRRSKVIAYIRARDSGTGKRWIELISEALGNQPWSHQEGPGAYQVTIKIPYAPGGYTPGIVAKLARAITPAHLDLLTGYNEGFLVGISQIGIDVL